MPSLPTYGAVARTFHWGIAGLLLLQIPLAFYMLEQPLGLSKLSNYGTHKSLGLLLFTLTALRLVWRLTHRAPPLPHTIPRWQRFTARTTQTLLYLLLFLMPITGLFRSQAANIPVSFLGLFAVPRVVGVDPTFSLGMREAHHMQSTLLLALIALHGLAALYHHWRRKDGVPRSMWPAGWNPLRSDAP